MTFVPSESHSNFSPVTHTVHLQTIAPKKKESNHEKERGEKEGTKKETEKHFEAKDWTDPQRGNRKKERNREAF
jgi:hypothetical protein